MQLETFRGRGTAQVLEQVRAHLGEDAWVLTTRFPANDRTSVELVAAPGQALHDLETVLEMGEPTWTSRRTADERPRIVALVGPTGAGKTTTAVKLALHRGAYGYRRPGFLCLDTYRAGAIEQLGLYAAAADLPVAVCHGPEDLIPALNKLGSCDVLIVDTPGRTPEPDDPDDWTQVLRRLAPDEVHLALPATRSLASVSHTVGRYRTLGITHVVLTKLDEAPTAVGGAMVALQSGLPCRWTTTGPGMPGALESARRRLFTALGMSGRAAPDLSSETLRGLPTSNVA